MEGCQSRSASMGAPIGRRDTNITGTIYLIQRVANDQCHRGVAGLKNKLQAAVAHVTPSGVLAEQHRKMAEPGTAKRVR